MNPPPQTEIRFPTFDGGVMRALVGEGARIVRRVEWTILDVTATSDDEPDDSCGSSGFSYDTFEFGATDLVLRSIIWSVPDVSIGAEIARPWIQAPVVSGHLVLPAFESFGIDRVEARCFLPEADTLVGLRAGEAPPEWRLDLGSDLALLVSGGEYRGWALRRATAHLASPLLPSTPTPAIRPDAEARAAVAEVLRLTGDGAADRVRARDAKTIADLIEVRHRLSKLASDNGAQAILVEWLGEALGG